MKAHPPHLFKLALAADSLPSLCSAAPPTTTPRHLDLIYWLLWIATCQDQVSQDMSGLNIVLCFMEPWHPIWCSNSGDYIALVIWLLRIQWIRGKSSNTGVNYISVQVIHHHVEQLTHAGQDLAWYESRYFNSNNPRIRLRFTSTQQTLPYGIFRMDYCVQNRQFSFDTQMGYIDASKSGLAYLHVGTKQWWHFYELALQLSSSSSTNSGSGIVVKK